VIIFDIMNKPTYTSVALGFLSAVVLSYTTPLTADTQCCANPYVGRWALTIPGGRAGWLGVEQQANGTLKGSILWGGGSVVPVSETRMENNTLVVVRHHNRKQGGKNVRHVETITAKLDNGKLALNTHTVDETGRQIQH
jgi:hypothetical protein